jgi:acyl-CoA synthetase (AMP-forming)/AMP-acid ligase II
MSALEFHPEFIAQSAPDKPAFVMLEDGAAVTYGELVERAARAANLFASLGINQGDTIAFLLENHIRYPELLWAAKNSGLRYVAVSTHLNATDAAYIVQDCGARLLVSSAAMGRVALEAVQALAAAPVLLMLDGAVAPFLPYEELVAAQPATRLQNRRRGASMLYSSGTTGRPKGIRTEIPDLPPEIPPQRFAMVQKQYGFDAATVFINPGPFYHAGPLRFMMMVQRAGGTVIGARRFDAQAVLDAIGQYGGTHGFFVPTMFSRMLKLDEPVRNAADVGTMRHAIHGAAPCPPEVKRAMIAWWGPVIDELYSGTEAVGHTFISAKEWLAHPGSVGKPAANCRIKIVSPAGEALPPGEPGRILMSNGLEVAYHGAAAAASKLYEADGFASLGDIGYLDEDGYLYLTDRQNHMIISGGVNIYPQEAEMVITTHPAVADAAVIGVPHPDMGEEVKAVVQPVSPPADPSALEAELIAFCRERLSAIKCPRSVDFVDSLPRNDMGKLVKRLVREPYWRGHTRAI